MKIKRSLIYKLISTERDRQDAKFGSQRSNSDTKWMAILGEEFGEACKNVLDGEIEKARVEILQVAAVCVAILEFCPDLKALRKEIANDAHSKG